MNKSSYIAIIVEGASREQQIVKNMISVYFSSKSDRFKVISFPAEQNIYMLWKRLKEDDYETDLIEVIREYSSVAAETLGDLTREDFSEVYLFFDYDGHQKNLSHSENSPCDVLKEMLEAFDNETELGKLYVSYPMVEALRDYVPEQCVPATTCFWKNSDFERYKHETGVKGRFTNFTLYGHSEWCDVINVFMMRLSCLFQKATVFTFEEYRRCISPLSTLAQQYRFIQNREIFVLSAFPSFLLDYFKIDFWKATVKYTRRRYGMCGLQKKQSCKTE